MMKICKDLIIFMVFILCITGIQSTAQAMLTGMADDENDATCMDSGSFSLYGSDGMDWAAADVETNSLDMAPNLFSIEDIAGEYEPSKAIYVQRFAEGPSSIAFGSAEDLVEHGTPIPASALLLITGLVGLIGFRRRMLIR